MVRIFFSNNPGSDYVIWTDVGDNMDVFIGQLAIAVADAIKNLPVDDELPSRTAVFLESVLARALPIAFKIAGYKAEAVGEYRVLINGPAGWSDSRLAGQGGRAPGGEVFGISPQ